MELLLVVLSVLAVSVNGQIITRFDKNITVSDGEDVRLECVISGLSDGQHVAWNLMDRKTNIAKTISVGNILYTDGSDPTVANSQKRYELRITGSTYTIRIDDANMRDEGAWTCSVLNTLASESVWLTVRTRPVISGTYFVKIGVDATSYEPTPNELMPAENTSLILDCRATGSPEPSITWHKPSGRLPNGQYLSHGRYLELVNITSQGRGDYQCSASNTEGTATSTVTIAMRHKPVVKVEYEVVKAMPDDTAELRCTFEANPSVSAIKWIKVNTGSSVYENTEDEIKIEDSSTQTVLIFGDVNTDHYGQYRCEIRNIMGITKKTIRLERGVADVRAEAGLSISGCTTLYVSWIVMVTAMFAAMWL